MKSSIVIFVERVCLEINIMEEIEMDMIEIVRKQMVEAMKQHDKERKETLSMLLSALKKQVIDKREELTEAEEFAVVKKEIKQTKETLESAPKDRSDIIEECKKKILVYQEFAPEEMSAEEIKKVIYEVLSEEKIETPTIKDKGRIMKNLMPRVKGKADGGLVNQLVGEIFQ